MGKGNTRVFDRNEIWPLKEGSELHKVILTIGSVYQPNTDLDSIIVDLSKNRMHGKLFQAKFLILPFLQSKQINNPKRHLACFPQTCVLCVEFCCRFTEPPGLPLPSCTSQWVKTVLCPSFKPTCKFPKPTSTVITEDLESHRRVTSVSATQIVCLSTHSHNSSLAWCARKLFSQEATVLPQFLQSTDVSF